MENEQTGKRWIKRLTLIWVLLGALLAVAAVTGVIDRQVFQWAFFGGFAVWVLIVTLLSQ
jgi:uncharacterized membrane protein YcaP (DUF421 family)